MDTARFDRLTQTVSILLSRRVMAGSIGLAALAWPTLVGAKKKRRKKKKSKPNVFGCIDVGKFCTNSGQCCSGICKGKKGKKKCQAHDQGACQPGPICNSGDDVPCFTDAGEVGTCLTTTGNAGYCSRGGGCFACTKDADCVPFCGPRAACLRCPDCIPSAGTQTTCNGPLENGCQFPP